jgi:hypothetical protein
MYHRGSEVPSSSKQNLNTKKLEVTESKSNNTQFWILYNSHDKYLSSRLYHHVWHTHMCVNHKSLTCSKLNNMILYAKIKLWTMTNYSTQIVEKWVLNVKCLCCVYEIEHRKLSDHIYIFEAHTLKYVQKTFNFQTFAHLWSMDIVVEGSPNLYHSRRTIFVLLHIWISLSKCMFSLSTITIHNFTKIIHSKIRWFKIMFATSL